jgi:hypothetical protein
MSKKVKISLFTILVLLLSAIPSYAIVNGTTAVGSNFVVALWVGDAAPQAGCTGAYLRPRVVVTGAHCVIKGGGRAPELTAPIDQFYVSQPGIDLRSPEARQSKVHVLKIWTEPDYFNRWDPDNNFRETQVNDVAFLFLEKELEGVPLSRGATKEEVEEFRTGNLSAFHLGYGMNGGPNGLITTNDGKPYLVEGIVGTQSHPAHIPIRERHLNVIYPVGKSLAPGDSGSPLMMKKGNEVLYIGTIYAGGGWVDLAKGDLSIRGAGAVTVLWPFIKTLDEQWISFLKEEQEILERNLLKKEADTKAALDKKAAEEKAALDKRAAEEKAAAEKKLLMEKAMDSGQFYREMSSCHSNSIVAELQTNKSGKWETVAPTEGWIEIAPIGDRACFQPWAVYKASKGEFLRWRLAIPNQWEVFSSAIAETTSFKEAEIAAAILKVEEDLKAAADLKAKQEAEAKAAADLKAKQEAEAAAEKILSDAKAEAARILAEAKAATKKITITCMKGKLTKKVTAIKPKCPSGYKKKP